MPTSASTDVRTGEQTEQGQASQRLVGAVRRFFEARDRLRRGVCLLNAGRYADATREFSAAAEANPEGKPLPSYLAAALAGEGRYAEAADDLEEIVNHGTTDVPTRIRHALSKWAAGDRPGAILSLRQGVEEHPGSAELHFQLGTLLGAMDQHEEAEFRFTQAVAIDGSHVDALVGLGMCEGARGAVRHALRHLERAQHLRPEDTRLNMLLSLAAQAVSETGERAPTLAAMPAFEESSDEAIDELSRVIEVEPDFVDAFLSLPAGDVDEEVFSMLAATLRQALSRQPEHADLYYHCSRVLERLGHCGEAIELTERAVALKPRSVKALIHLAKLYQQTDRLDDAATRLEESIRLGAEYADTYYMLGNLYRDTDRPERARWAYGNALRINDRYEAARQALESLTGS